jgi:hypothetical protein
MTPRPELPGCLVYACLAFVAVWGVAQVCCLP